VSDLPGVGTRTGSIPGLYRARVRARERHPTAARRQRR
jgi:hypothetical protein